MLGIEAGSVTRDPLITEVDCSPSWYENVCGPAWSVQVLEMTGSRLWIPDCDINFGGIEITKISFNLFQGRFVKFRLNGINIVSRIRTRLKPDVTNNWFDFNCCFVTSFIVYTFQRSLEVISDHLKKIL